MTEPKAPGTKLQDGGPTTYTPEVAQIISRLHTPWRLGYVSADTLAQMRAAKPLAPS